jgi:hypothetical protein
MGAHPLTEMRARRSRRALSTWRRYSASTTGAAMAAAGLEMGERSGRGRGSSEEAETQDNWPRIAGANQPLVCTIPAVSFFPPSKILLFLLTFYLCLFIYFIQNISSNI